MKQLSINPNNNEKINLNYKNIKIYTDPNEMFDLIIGNSKFKSIFINEIRDIIKIMNDILYTPPFPNLYHKI